MKALKITYYTTTGLLTAMMLMSVGRYLYDISAMQEMFTQLGHPGYLVVPLAIAKLLGLIAIWTKKNNSLTEWAYAGFFFNFQLAWSAHVAVGDGQAVGGILATILLFGSYVTYKKLGFSSK